MGRPRQRIQKTCPTCRGAFEIIPSKSSRIFCSNECHGVAKRRRQAVACIRCGTVFEVTEHQAQRERRFCSKACWYAVRTTIRRDWRERLWEKIDRRGPSECWPWTGSRDGRGYGMFMFSSIRDVKRNMKAHRAAYVSENGPVPDDVFVCHRCDNPPCCNPAHLFPAHHQGNVDDMVAKGRHRGSGKGQAAPTAKLTDEAVRRIRSDPRSSRAVAAELGVGKSTINSVRAGETWKHVR